MLRSLVVVLALWPAIARADDLIARGEAFAQQGDFTHAIALFKQADATAPSAANACRIGLAYTRRELWSQAEIFFERCERRATASDPIPDWLPAAKQQLEQKLAAVDAAPIDVHVEPKLESARVLISSFLPDESFPPRTIHLAPGTYVITAVATGREPASTTLTVVPKTAQIVTLVLAEPPPPPPPPPTRAQRIGTKLLYVAAGAAIVGAGFHLAAMNERGQLDGARAADDPVAWDHHAGRFETARAVTIGCYAGAIVTGALGLFLRTRGAESPIVTTSVGQRAAMIGIEWHR